MHSSVFSTLVGYSNATLLSRACKYVLAILLFALALRYRNLLRRNVPVANSQWLQLRTTKKNYFLLKGLDNVIQARVAGNGKPFKLLTHVGEAIILPPKYANIILNESHLSFGKFLSEEFQSHISGFEPFQLAGDGTELVGKVIRKHLTKTLGSIMKPLSIEASFAIGLTFGNSQEWCEVNIHEPIREVVARITWRIFLGEEACRNKYWLETSNNYVVHCLAAATRLSPLHRSIKPLLQWFLPDCRILRQDFDQARKFITSLVEKRRELKRHAQVECMSTPTFNDVLEWSDKESGGKPYDPVRVQLLLGFAAIHTTTDLVTHALTLLAKSPDAVRPLREEMINVLGAEGWTKNSLDRMALLDSALKEALRLKPPETFSMHRKALDDIILPDGLVIRKGERVLVDHCHMTDPRLYENPEEFDIHRFLRMRENPQCANVAQLVVTSPEHLGFGHGKHGCPGRFYAAKVMKVTFCYLLLRYDWKLVQGSDLEPINIGFFRTVNPEARVLYKRRKEEINLESLRAD